MFKHLRLRRGPQLVQEPYLALTNMVCHAHSVLLGRLQANISFSKFSWKSDDLATLNPCLLVAEKWQELSSRELLTFIKSPRPHYFSLGPVHLWVSPVWPLRACDFATPVPHGYLSSCHLDADDSCGPILHVDAASYSISLFHLFSHLAPQSLYLSNDGNVQGSCAVHTIPHPPTPRPQAATLVYEEGHHDLVFLYSNHSGLPSSFIMYAEMVIRWYFNALKHTIFLLIQVPFFIHNWMVYLIIALW